MLWCEAAGAAICPHDGPLDYQVDGSGTIYTHRDFMVNLCADITDAGMTINDQYFYENFTNSLPSSLAARPVHCPLRRLYLRRRPPLRQIRQLRDAA